MTDDVEEVLESLKRRFRASTDQALAERLSLGRSTVTSWRRRGSIPERYARLAQEVLSFPPDFVDPRWTATERAALSLALLRLIKGFGAQLTDYPTVLAKQGFLPAQLAMSVERALLELSARMTESGIEDPTQCLSLMAYEEFFANK